MTLCGSWEPGNDVTTRLRRGPISQGVLPGKAMPQGCKLGQDHIMANSIPALVEPSVLRPQILWNVDRLWIAAAK